MPAIAPPDRLLELADLDGSRFDCGGTAGVEVTVWVTTAPLLVITWIEVTGVGVHVDEGDEGGGDSLDVETGIEIWEVIDDESGVDSGVGVDVVEVGGGVELGDCTKSARVTYETITLGDTDAVVVCTIVEGSGGGLEELGAAVVWYNTSNGRLEEQESYKAE
ncbi:MAG: hypothetical protein M1820_004647 [Bogoriella megaspora]|nr:MAG: hypothetical protein M1820_004647 [Bogoriella megaspora]